MSERITVYTSTRLSNFRIPCVVATAAGTVVAFANRRLDTVADDADEVELVVRRLGAGERDFEEMQTLFARPGWQAALILSHAQRPAHL